MSTLIDMSGFVISGIDNMIIKKYMKSDNSVFYIIEEDNLPTRTVNTWKIKSSDNHRIENLISVLKRSRDNNDENVR